MRKTISTWSAGLLLGALAACTGGGGSPVTTSATVGQADAARFLEQSSFGPTPAEIAKVQQLGFAAYLQEQFARPAPGYPGFMYMDPDPKKGCPTGSAATCRRDNYSVFPVQAQFFRNAISGSDQLRQRVALALSQIFVTSGIKINQPYAMAAYQQMLLNDAFLNYRTLLNDITLSPVMGHYLDMVNNNKANSAAGTGANENYAREVLQLFSIGLVQLNSDGTPRVDAGNHPIPTYNQATIENFANAFTGWTYPPMPGQIAKWTDPVYFLGSMVPVETHHDTTAKTLLDGTLVPAGGSAAIDLKIALDNIFNHANAGPFIGKQLIKHLVTSNPSPAYVQRVSDVFANNGQGIRGDMQSVIQQILLDPEARGDAKTAVTYGKLREPALFVANTLRSIGGRSDGVYLLRQSAALEQNIFSAASVFNFYPPDYPLTGTQQVGPSFGVYDATSSLNRVNFVNALLSATNGIAPDSMVSGATGTQIDIAAWQSAAADSTQLVNRINSLLFHNAMSIPMQNLLVQSVNAIPAGDPLNRARVGLYLALTSSQFQVEQ